MAFEYPSPRDVKKAMQVTWSDTKSSDNEISNPGNIKYEQNNCLAFVASVISLILNLLLIVILIRMFVHLIILF